MPPYHMCGRMPPQSSGRINTSMPAAASALAARSASMRMRNVRIVTSGESVTARILAGSCSNRVEKPFAEVGGLAFANTVHGAQRGHGRRLETRHFTQRGVVENDIRRQVAFSGDREADRAQGVEQLPVHALPRLGFNPRTPRLPIFHRPPLARERQVRMTGAVF